jgi:BNR-Asp box repeat protein
VVYAIVESKDGTLYRSDDRGETFRNVSKQESIVSRGFYYTTVRVDPTNEDRVYAVASTLFVSPDGGKTFRSITGRSHIDFHALWIDPKNPKRMWHGQDGGIGVSYDGGESWEAVYNIPLGQFYQVHADNRQPFYNVMGGLQDNGSWTGPSRTREPAGIMNDDWRMVSFGDGFYVINHPDNPDVYLSESQGGHIVWTDFRTREQQLVNPWGRGSGGGPAAGKKFRWNWNAPIVLSPHEKTAVYFGGNVLFKSPDFGKTWEQISPDLTTNDPEKLKDAGGPVAIENSTAEYHSTIITIAESPVQKGQIWAGTDDGNLQVTTDGGKNWANVVKNVPGLAANSPVSHVEPARVNASTAYVAFERHMFDDFRPYIFKTTDGGKSWTNISGNLPPKAYVQIVREDPKNPNLLYAGTELGLFASYDGGQKWIPLNLKNLPNVAVHDILVHPRENDLILATHGRSLWIFDDATVIQQMTPQILESNAHLFSVRPGLRFASMFTRYGIGDKVFTGPNPAPGALITYYLKEKLDEKADFKIQIFDRDGKLVQDLERPSREKGLNRITWNLRLGGPEVRRPPTPEQIAFGGGPRGPRALPGTYTVKLTVAGKVYEQPVEVKLDPGVTTPVSELQESLDMQIKLRDMQTVLNTSLRFLDSVKEQLKQAQTTMKNLAKEPDKDLMKALEDYLKEVDTLQDKLAARDEGLGFPGRDQVADDIGSLFGSLDGNFGPTRGQRDYFAEIQPAYRARMGDVNKFLRETLPQWNEKLRGWNAPTLTTRKPFEF